MTDITKTSYNNTVISATGNVTARSQIPTDINQTTTLALTSALRSAQNNIVNVSDSIKNYSQTQQTLQLSNNLNAALSNFKPVLSTNINNAIKQRIPGKVSALVQQSSSARNLALAGVSPITKGIADQIKALTSLSAQKEQLMKQTEGLKNQIDSLTQKLIEATNTGNLEQLRLYEALIDDIQKQYDNALVILSAIRKAWIARDTAWRKLVEEKRRLEKKWDDTMDRYDMMYNAFIEIPLNILFPSFPKLPSLNLTKASFKQIISNLKSAVIAAGKEGAKKSIDQASRESKPKIDTGNDQDAFQKAASTVKDTIMNARKAAEKALEVKNAAILAAADALKGQVTGLQKQASVMEANINNSIDTERLRIDSNIKNIRPPVTPAAVEAAQLTKQQEQAAQQAKESEIQYAKQQYQKEQAIRKKKMDIEDYQLFVAQSLTNMNRKKKALDAAIAEDPKDVSVEQEAYDRAVKEYNDNKRILKDFMDELKVLTG